MAGSDRPGPLGRNLLGFSRTPGTLGWRDAAAPDALAVLTGNTPGALGRNDWGDPDHPAYGLHLGDETLPGWTHPSLPEFKLRVPFSTHAETEVGVLHGSHRSLPGPHKRRAKLPAGVPTGMIEEPPWLKIACEEDAKDIHELRGQDENNPRILEYLASVPGLALIPETIFDRKRGRVVPTGKMMSEVDETAWCACFLNWCLKKAGLPGGKASAKAWLHYGTELPIDAPRVGAIVVLHHEPKASISRVTRSGYHVGFYIGGSSDNPVLLGGNQDDSVCRKQMPAFEVKGYRWPSKKKGG